MTTFGGAELGRGFNGMVMDVHSSDASDKGTLYAMLNKAVQETWTVYTIESTTRGRGTKVTDAHTKNAILDALRSKSSSGYVAKVALSRMAMSTKEVFEKEVHASAAIIRAYGKGDAAKYLAMGAIPVSKGLNVLAIIVPSKDIYSMFNLRCGQTLDDRVIPSNAELKSITVQLLTSLGILHKVKWLHTDLKPDNVIYCSDSKQYKLIDFGGAVSFSSQKLLESSMSFPTVLRTRSPFAWYIAGANATMSIAMSKTIVSILYRAQFKAISPSAEIMYEGFSKRVQSMIEANGGDEDRVRCELIRSMLPCIDTSALALAFVSVLESQKKLRGSGVTAPARTRMLKFLHERMLDAGNPLYMGHDAKKLAALAKKELL